MIDWCLTPYFDIYFRLLVVYTIYQWKYFKVWTKERPLYKLM